MQVLQTQGYPSLFSGGKCTDLARWPEIGTAPTHNHLGSFDLKKNCIDYGCAQHPSNAGTVDQRIQ
jgi:hypothetical protein